ncbi:MAG: DUF1851 domain-containing protein [Spirochaetales bacterium]|nr:DUF1851 domain-containing protein [Spirochaetales bacterium]
MINTYIEYFFRYMGPGEKYNNISDDVIEKYRGKIKAQKDEVDIITHLWQNYGLCSFRNGLFWLVNPDEYSPIAKRFSRISESAIVFGRSGMGGLFIFDKLDIGDSIIYLNPHHDKTKIISTGVQVFMTFDIPAETFWNRECYGKFEIPVIEKFGKLTREECYTFVPALHLGGNESMKNIEKGNIKTVLDLLSQK